MKSLDEVPIKVQIELYYVKHHAMRHGDMEKLLELKNKYPELFEKEKDTEILNIIQRAKDFQASDRYKELCKLKLKNKLTIINNDL